MEKLLNKNNILIITALLIAAGFIGGAQFKHSDAQAIAAGAAAVPFGGRIATEVLCCNGIMFSLTPEKEISSPAHPGILPNSFMFEYKNWPALPFQGYGLYDAWTLMIGNGVLGDATSVGKCILYPDCTPEKFIPSIWNIKKAGTTLIPGP